MKGGDYLFHRISDYLKEYVNKNVSIFTCVLIPKDKLSLYNYF